MFVLPSFIAITKSVIIMILTRVSFKTHKKKK